jgi:1-acyl-sn-glycerol-3-phosphate acyltransferase
MQNIILEEPYEFVSPIESDWWVWFLRFRLRRYLRRYFGVDTHDCRHVERLRQSIDAGYGVLLCPNHSRMSDPLVMGLLTGELKRNVFTMASWHLFMEGWYQRAMLRRLGAFSIYREGNDRQSVNCAIDILVEGRRPLVIFPEGAVSRHCDILMDVMDGPGFIARQAAKRREKEGKPPVVIHPVAVRYAYNGDPHTAVAGDLERLERGLSWEPQTHLSTVERLRKLGEAVLAVKEVEYTGSVRSGDPFDRVEELAMSLLTSLEDKWKIKDRSGGIVSRVKNLRGVILPDMIAKKVTEEERAARWRDLGACYYIQQMAHYPRKYLRTKMENLPERILETVERLVEDFTDKSLYHGPLHVTIDVGEPIMVESQRERGSDHDPAMVRVAVELQGMLTALADERRAKLGLPPREEGAP